MLAHLIGGICLALATRSPQGTGKVTGRVVNGSRANEPAAVSAVVLQIFEDGQFIPIATTNANDLGEFLFDDLPVGEDLLFRVGATLDEVFYPGDRFQLTPLHDSVFVKSVVYDSVLGSSPLVALRHEIVIRPEPGLLNVIETMLIANPSLACYAGESNGNKGSVTLRLRIPPNFVKVTFHKEFYGRRFALIDGNLVTTIPWPPGERELTFTYVVPIEKRHEVWERPLDLPCSDVRVTVVTANSADVTCDLGPAVPDVGSVAYKSRDELLPAGHIIRVELGRLPVHFTGYARWIALGILICLILTALLSIGIRDYANRRRPAGTPAPNFWRRKKSMSQKRAHARYR